MSWTLPMLAFIFIGFCRRVRQALAVRRELEAHPLYGLHKLTREERGRV